MTEFEKLISEVGNKQLVKMYQDSSNKMYWQKREMSEGWRATFDEMKIIEEELIRRLYQGKSIDNIRYNGGLND